MRDGLDKYERILTIANADCKFEKISIDLDKYNVDIKSLDNDSFRKIYVDFMNDYKDWAYCSQRFKVEKERIYKLLTIEMNYRKNNGENIKPLTLADKRFPDIFHKYSRIYDFK